MSVIKDSLALKIIFMESDYYYMKRYLIEMNKIIAERHGKSELSKIQQLTNSKYRVYLVNSRKRYLEILKKISGKLKRY